MYVFLFVCIRGGDISDKDNNNNSNDNRGICCEVCDVRFLCREGNGRLMEDDVFVL